MRSSARTASSRANSIRTSARRRMPRSGSRSCRRRTSPQGRGKARGVRSAWVRLAAGPGIPAAARLGQRLRVHAGARWTRRSRGRARPGPARTSATSFPSCSARAARSVAHMISIPRPRRRRSWLRVRRPGPRRTCRDRSRGCLPWRNAHARTARRPRSLPDGHVTSKPRTLRVSIPAGVVEGQQIRLAGPGQCGRWRRAVRRPVPRGEFPGRTRCSRSMAAT